MELSVGSVLSRVGEIYREQAGVLIGTAIVLYALQFVIDLLLPGAAGIAIALLFFVLSILYQGMVVELVQDVQDGRRDHSVGQLLRAVEPVLPTLVLVAILFAIGVGLIHHSHEESYSEHRHPSVGILSALALSGHSFLDGVGIGLGFQISSSIGTIVAIAVIAHDFSDGLNTASLMLVNNNSVKRSFLLLLLDATTPILGVISTLFISFSPLFLTLYLGFFAGFLLYIGAADILPEAHSQDSSLKTVLMTVLGVLFIFIVVNLA